MSGVKHSADDSSTTNIAEHSKLLYQLCHLHVTVCKVPTHGVLFALSAEARPVDLCLCGLPGQLLLSSPFPLQSLSLIFNLPSSYHC